MTKFLLILGPSGVGKSTIINDLRQLDTRFTYISPFITRPLRTGEEDKISIPNHIMDEMDHNGLFLTVNDIYGIRYATPRLPITQALEDGMFPVLDWPVGKLDTMKEAFPGKLLSVYIEPPSLEELKERLGKDGRDADGHRFNEAMIELNRLWAGDFDGQFDFREVSRTDEIGAISQRIYGRYVESLGEGNRRGREFG